MPLDWAETASASPAMSRHWFLLLLAASYLLVGTIGHDPWRGDDASHFGPILELLSGGAWLIPSPEGGPAIDYGPLFYWIAASVAATLKWLLPVHDGARLTSALLTACALFALWRAADRMHGKQASSSAVLLTLGSLGLVVHVHEIQPALGLLAAQAGLLWLLLSPSPMAIVGAGVAAAAAFLFGGLQGTLATWPLLLLGLTTAGPGEGRQPGRALASLVVALAVTLAWALPAARSPGWMPWFDAQVLSLTPEAATLSGVSEWFKLFGWFLWPLWPLAMWSLWRAHRGAQIRHVPLLLCALLLALLGVVLSGGLRPVRMLPLIVPLALLAAPAVERLRRGAAAAFDWFAMMSFSALALLLWLAWSALVLQWPPGLARHFKKLAPAFELSPGTPALAIGAALVAAWVIYLWRRRPGGRDAPLTWATGMTMLWCIAAAMLQPWFDHNRSYREVAVELAAVLADQPGTCVAGVSLGAAQRASIRYFADIDVKPAGVSADCPLVLVYTDTRMNPRDLSQFGSTRLWHYERGGGRQRESLVLLRRD